MSTQTTSPGLSRARLHFANNRIHWSRAILAITILVALCSEPPIGMRTWILHVLELAGYAMLVAATLWRIWCLTFIGGSKDGQLAVTGPYSVVRNPLYVGSFIGIVGIGLALKLPMLAVGLAMAFGILYPAVVAQEEERLAGLFGPVYVNYCAAVPRWLPRWSAYHEPEHVLVSTAKVRQGIVDGMWYLWAFAFVELLEVLREHGVLPLFF